MALLGGRAAATRDRAVWMQNIARWNPFSWATNGMRALFRGELSDPAVWQGAGIVGVLAALTVVWSARLFSRTIR